MVPAKVEKAKPQKRPQVTRVSLTTSPAWWVPVDAPCLLMNSGSTGSKALALHLTPVQSPAPHVLSQAWKLLRASQHMPSAFGGEELE